MLHLAERFRGGGPQLAGAITEAMLLYLRVLAQHALIAPSGAPARPVGISDVLGGALAADAPADKGGKGKRPNGKLGQGGAANGAEGGAAASGSGGGGGGGEAAAPSAAELTGEVVATLQGAREAGAALRRQVLPTQSTRGAAA